MKSRVLEKFMMTKIFIENHALNSGKCLDQLSFDSTITVGLLLSTECSFVALNDFWQFQDESVFCQNLKFFHDRCMSL